MLSADAVADAVQGRPLNQIATFTGRWRHQVHASGRAVLAARSVGEPGPDGRVLDEVWSDPTVAAVDDAVAWVDANTTGDPLVRLLVAPAVDLTALWLLDAAEGGDGLLVVARPEGAGSLEQLRLYPAADAVATAAAIGIVRGRARKAPRRKARAGRPAPAAREVRKRRTKKEKP
jgi:hypothetical protein